MATYCLQYNPNFFMPSAHARIKMERDSGDDEPTSRPSSSPAIPITTVMTVNENWRGKNDPAERRRIQNRLNQRAFRQRQRAGESPRQYKPRSVSRSSEGQQDESDDDAESVKSEGSPSASGSYVEGRVSTPSGNRQTSSSRTDSSTGQVWDELAQLINRNLMSAAVTNAQHIGVDFTALQAGTAMKTPRPTGRAVPTTLTPVELQYQVAHDPIIDTIPHVRLRYNILRGIATNQLDAAAFSSSIRSSGALEEANGSWQRGGVVVWSSPEQVGSWELSEPFVRRWSSLLQGCEDLVAATNAWRSRRGERLFPNTFGRRA